MESSRIAIVDDDDNARTILAATLQRFGYAVDAFDRVDTCLAEVDRDGSMKALILDIMMPDQDGIEMLRQLAIRNVSVPVILVSGSSSDFLRLARKLGETWNLNVVGALEKPISPSALESLLASVAARA